MAGIVLLAIYIFFNSAVPNYEGTETLPGLKEPVVVSYDKNGLPHVVAKSEIDLYYAQGYLVARERLFQMDMTRLAGRGELSTMFGDRTIEKDRFLRTIGLYRHAQKSFKLLTKDSQQAVQAYVDGVNHFINSTSALPREYAILDASPQPFTVYDSLAMSSVMGYSLTRSKKIDLVLNQVREKVGDDAFAQFIPKYPDIAPTVAQGKRVFSHENPLPPSLFSSTATSNAALDKVLDDFPFPLEIAASNWMIFSGDMTESGKPLFAGSPDLSPTLPALFYLMHIQAPGIDAIGGVLPGLPGMGPVGFNGHFAYSTVNGRGDELDYFVQKLNPDNGDQYLTPEGYRDFEIIQDSIKIKNDDGFELESITIKVSRHGPMISDVLPNAPANTSMLWSGLDLPSTGIDGLMKMLKADSIETFRAGAKLVTGMNLVVGYADIDGNIGWQFTASTPIRKKGYGSLPMPGWTGEYDWIGYVPFEEVPYEFNPESGYVASFNNDPGNTDYHTSNFYLFERAIRFEELMNERPAGKKVDFNELKTMQKDTKSAVAQRWAPLVLAVCEKDLELKNCQNLFKDWDYRIDMDSEAATLFNYFYYVFMQNTIMDEVGEDLWKNALATAYLYYVPDIVMLNIFDQPGHKLYDDTNTPARENREDILAKSILQAQAYLTERLGDNWQWGDAHKMSFSHPLGSNLPMLNLEPVKTAGSHHTISSGFWDTGKPFEMNSGGVIRIMMDFNDLSTSTLISPPGQSGHYLSPFYSDQAQTWAAGDQIPMHFEDFKSQSTTLTLVP